MTHSEKQDKYLHKVLKEPPLKYQEDGQLTLFSEEQLAKGRIFDIGVTGPTEPHLFYQHPNGAIHIGDSIDWLASLPAESVDLILADPPYNIKKAEWDTFESQQAYVDWSLKWIKEAARALTPWDIVCVWIFRNSGRHQTARAAILCRLSLAGVAL